jgi:hypothetical protein
MKKEPQFGDRILWVGDKAAETFRKTNATVRDQFHNRILLYENRSNNAPEKNVTYLKDLASGEYMDYEPKQLQEALRTVMQKEGMEETDLLIGSSYELMFQQLLELYKKDRSDSKKEDVKPEMLFSYSLSREMDALSKKSDNTRKVLFLHQDIPFRDMIAESKETMERARNNFMQAYATKRSETDISEFLFRMTDDSQNTENNEIEKL